MKLHRSKVVGWCFSMVAALSGGMMFGGCPTRIKDTVFGSTSDFFLSQQFATTVTQAIFSGINDVTTSGQ